MTTLAVDVGQSASRLRLVDGAGAREVAARGLRAGHDAVEDLVEIVLGVLQRTGCREPVEVVSVGMTGLQGNAADAARLLQACRPTLGTHRVLVADDSLTSFVGALGVRPGVVLAAGTGVTVLAWDAGARHRKVDGWGYLLGDAGGGYWIGRVGLDQAMRAFDGRGGSPALLELLRVRSADPARYPLELAGDPDRVARIASFAHAVADAARGGDQVANDIWRDAADELARSLLAGCDWLSAGARVTVAWTGNLFDVGALLLDPLRQRLAGRHPAVIVEPAAGSSLDGALLLSRARELPDLSPLLTVEPQEHRQ